MNESKKAKRIKERADLQRKIRECEAQLIHVYHFADAALDKAGTKYMGLSGVLVTMHALGGREIIKKEARESRVS